LNEKRLEYHDHIEMWSAAAFDIVLIHSFKQRSELFPIQSTPNIDQLITKIFDPFVFQTKGKISEASHETLYINNNIHSYRLKEVFQSSFMILKPGK